MQQDHAGKEKHMSFNAHPEERLSVPPCQETPVGRIGIGVTTHNRPDMLKKTMEAITRFSPQGAKIVVVDDASDIPVEGATYRFEENVGIARAKNKCFALLEECEHIFLFDDDIYPLQENWWKPYVASSEPHLFYMFENFATGKKINDAILLYSDSQINAWSHARGCMLYFARRCLDVVGGMDPIFGKWGEEHIELSGRIYNAGLTSFRFMDVTCSKGLFWSADEHKAIASSVLISERRQQLIRNKPLLAAREKSSDFIPYHEVAMPKIENNVVITCFFNRQVDLERGYHWKADYAALQPLIKSLGSQPLVILHDCLDVPDTPTITHINVETSIGPYWQRWISIYQYLLQHPEIDRAFCVDATDVEMLRNPFPEMGNYLYCGDEPCQIDIRWMRLKHPASTIQAFIHQFASHQLLNCGLLGGSREMLIRFIRAMLDAWARNVADVASRREKTVGHTEMGLFNYILLTQFTGLISHGSHVNTTFKKNERNDISWWKHK